MHAYEPCVESQDYASTFGRAGTEGREEGCCGPYHDAKGGC